MKNQRRRGCVFFPFGERRQPPGVVGTLHTPGVRVAPQRVVALGEEQDVVAHRRELPPAERARVGRGLQVLRPPELPPARLRGHFVVTVVIVPVVLVVVVVPTLVVTVVAVGTAVPAGQSIPVLDFSTRQLRNTVGPVRLTTVLTMSLETRAR